MNVEYIIIGSGFSGIQLGYFLNKNKKDYIILEKSNNLCNFFRTFPRHRSMLSINKVYTGYEELGEDFHLRHDWNSFLCDNPEMVFRNYSSDYYPKADDFTKYVEDFVNYYKLNILLNTNIVKIRKEKDNFSLKDKNNLIYNCKYLIIATGYTKAYIPKNINNIHLAIGYETMSLNPEDYKNKRVLIIGKGNSAFETANSLVEVTAFINLISRKTLKLAWETYLPTDVRAINNTFIDSYKLKSLNFLSDGNSDLKKNKNGTISIQQTNRIEYDTVLRCTGWEFDLSIFDNNCIPEINSDLNIQKNIPNISFDYQSKNIKNMYFCGELLESLHYKKTTLPTIKAMRYTSRFLSRILEYNNDSKFFEYDTIKNEDITNIIINRLKTVSSSFNVFNYFCDLIVIGKNNSEFYEEIPIEYIFNIEQFKNKDLLLVYFTQPQENDVYFDSYKKTNENSNVSKNLHPIIRYISMKGKNHINYEKASPSILEEHHVLEDLHDNRWHLPCYKNPLELFIERNLNSRNNEIE